MISLCLIAGDESEGLESLLASITPFVDETVILDTSCGDRVRCVADHFGARLITHVFTDFAAVRQITVEEARGDWILVMDPDEEIDGNDLQALLAKTRDSAAVAFCVPRHDYIGSHGWTLSRPCRLFRRSPKPNYVGAVYEEPFWPEGFGGEPETVWGVTIHHSGFLQAETGLLRKRALYRILSEQTASAWDGVWLWRNRAMLAADAGDWNHALACAQEALRLARGTEASSLVGCPGDNVSSWNASNERGTAWQPAYSLQ